MKKETMTDLAMIQNIKNGNGDDLCPHMIVMRINLQKTLEDF